MATLEIQQSKKEHIKPRDPTLKANSYTTLIQFFQRFPRIQTLLEILKGFCLCDNFWFHHLFLERKKRYTLIQYHLILDMYSSALAAFMIDHFIDITSCFYYTVSISHISIILGHNLSRKKKMSNKQ